MKKHTQHSFMWMHNVLPAAPAELSSPAVALFYACEMFVCLGWLQPLETPKLRRNQPKLINDQLQPLTTTLTANVKVCVHTFMVNYNRKWVTESPGSQSGSLNLLSIIHV